MSIYIDSAKENEVRLAKEFGWVKGVTTNPSLLAQTGSPAEYVLDGLTKIGFDELFYQLTAPTLEGMVAEAEAAVRIIGSALILKVPPTELGFRFVAEHTNEYPFCLTAIYSPVQAAIAGEAGAKYVAVYVNRATRLRGDGVGLVRNVARVLSRSQTEILAASIKSADEAGAALDAGAHHLTVPYDVLCTLTNHPLSVQTIEQFDREGAGINFVMSR